MREKFQEFWAEGSTRAVGYTENGKKDGQFTIYFDNRFITNQIWGLANYSHGKKMGIWKTFHPNGQLQWQWEYENGRMKDGSYPEYNLKGELIGYNVILNHKMYNGHELLYWPDGLIKEENYIKEGKRKLIFKAE